LLFVRKIAVESGGTSGCSCRQVAIKEGDKEKAPTNFFVSA
jgi:hypothetical protein